MYSSFLHEPKLFAFAYDLEQALHPRSLPQFLGNVPPKPPYAGICDSARARTPQVFTGSERLPQHLGTGKPLNL